MSFASLSASFASEDATDGVPPVRALDEPDGQVVDTALSAGLAGVGAGSSRVISFLSSTSPRQAAEGIPPMPLALLLLELRTS